MFVCVYIIPVCNQDCFSLPCTYHVFYGKILNLYTSLVFWKWCLILEILKHPQEQKKKVDIMSRLLEKRPGKYCNKS